MFYAPITTLTTPVVVQTTRMITVPTTNYYVVQPTPVIPTVPVLTPAFVYPTLSVLTKPIIQDTSEQIPTSNQATPPVKHVIHHYIPSSAPTTCCDGCELCCPWSSSNRSPERGQRSRTPSPTCRNQQRYSRRDDYDRGTRSKSCESIDEKIERIRHELSHTSVSKRDKSTETIDYFIPKSTQHFENHRPKTAIESRVPYKQHYDAPKPRSRSRSASSHRHVSLPREPWRPTNRNDYPWRDAHLPAYREATMSRSNESLTWNETAHQRSHLNTDNRTSCPKNTDYVYRPKSECEARKYYIETTGKNPDREVYSAYNHQPSSPCNHSFYSDIPTRDVPQQVDCSLTNQSCLHIMPKHNSTLEPPYLKIYNAPVTYLH